MRKTRFYHEKRKRPLRKLLLSLILFAAVFFFFVYSTNFLSRKDSSEERKLLENAINRSIIQCYVIEGRYPDSLDYLKDNFGIKYNTDKYFIDYHIWGANIMPEVTIIERSEKTR